jgi:sugar/nucleoside kinase (ribokinase family)
MKTDIYLYGMTVLSTIHLLDGSYPEADNCREIKRFTPFKVEVKSTLGTGDTFRAGIVYGVLNGFSDEGIVRFAAAASVCKRFPMALNPPGPDEIQDLIDA